MVVVRTLVVVPFVVVVVIVIRSICYITVQYSTYE